LRFLDACPPSKLKRAPRVLAGVREFSFFFELSRCFRGGPRGNPLAQKPMDSASLRENQRPKRAQNKVFWFLRFEKGTRYEKKKDYSTHSLLLKQKRQNGPGILRVKGVAETIQRGHLWTEMKTDSGGPNPRAEMKQNRSFKLFHGVFLLENWGKKRTRSPVLAIS